LQQKKISWFNIGTFLTTVQWGFWKLKIYKAHTGLPKKIFVVT
jgi:hypothetical protein